MRIISIVLSVIALVGSIFAYRKTCKTIEKLEEMDNAIFQWMKEDFNSKVEAKE